MTLPLALWPEATYTCLPYKKLIGYARKMGSGSQWIKKFLGFDDGTDFMDKLGCI
jgi:hypothetical protein